MGSDVEYGSDHAAGYALAAKVVVEAVVEWKPFRALGLSQIDLRDMIFGRKQFVRRSVSMHIRVWAPVEIGQAAPKRPRLQQTEHGGNCFTLQRTYHLRAKFLYR